MPRRGGFDVRVDAILWVGSLGQTGFYAVGDVLSGADGAVSVDVTVTNTGSAAGRDVVELYLKPFEYTVKNASASIKYISDQQGAMSEKEMPACTAAPWEGWLKTANAAAGALLAAGVVWVVLRVAKNRL